MEQQAEGGTDRWGAIFVQTEVEPVLVRIGGRFEAEIGPGVALQGRAVGFCCEKSGFGTVFEAVEVGQFFVFVPVVSSVGQEEEMGLFGAKRQFEPGFCGGINDLGLHADDLPPAE